MELDVKGTRRGRGLEFAHPTPNREGKAVELAWLQQRRWKMRNPNGREVFNPGAA